MLRYPWVRIVCQLHTENPTAEMLSELQNSMTQVATDLLGSPEYCNDPRIERDGGVTTVIYTSHHATLESDYRIRTRINRVKDYSDHIVEHFGLLSWEVTSSMIGLVIIRRASNQ